MANDQHLINAFDDCINRLHAGETLEACLERYPALAHDLRPLLITSRLVTQAIPSSAETLAAQERMRAIVSRQVRIQPIRSQRRAFSPLVAAILLMIFLFGLTSATISSQKSIPGDILYPLKRASESIRLDLSNNQASLQNEFNERRKVEINQLLKKGRQADVSFTGVVETIAVEEWQIDGLAVTIVTNTQVDAAIKVGSRVRVEGYTSPANSLVANHIRLSDDNSPDSIDIPTPIKISPTLLTPTPMITPMPEITSLPEPSLTPSAEALTTCSITPEGNVAINIRSGGSTAHNIVGTLAPQQSMAVIGMNDANNQWYAVQLDTDQIGWIADSVSNIAGDCSSLPVLSYAPAPSSDSPSGPSSTDDDGGDDDGGDDDLEEEEAEDD